MHVCTWTRHARRTTPCFLPLLLKMKSHLSVGLLVTGPLSDPLALALVSILHVHKVDLLQHVYCTYSLHSQGCHPFPPLY